MLVILMNEKNRVRLSREDEFRLRAKGVKIKVRHKKETHRFHGRILVVQKWSKNSLYTFVAAGTFLIFFHPTLAFNARALVDDECYLKWLSRFLFFDYEACPNPYTFPGTALVWLPGAALARVVAFFTQTDLLPAITASIGVTAYLCWVASLFVLYQLVAHYTDKEKERFWLPLLFLFAIPVLHYATARSTMTHTAELLLCLSTLVFLQQRRFALALVFGILLTATRINDCPILLVILGSYLDDEKNWKRLKWPLVIVGLTSLPLLKIAFFSYYGGGSGLIPILRQVSWNEFNRVMVGDRYALVFTASFWLAALFAGSLFIKRLSWTGRAGLVWMWFLFFICMGWGGMGNSFGYRYLIGTYPLALIIAFELRKEIPAEKLALALIFLNALWITHLTWVYDHYSSLAELGGQTNGLLWVKQAIHPLKRLWEFSPLAISFKFLSGRSPEEFGFRGPFLASLTPFQLALNVSLTALAGALLAIPLLRWRHRLLFPRTRPSE